MTTVTLPKPAERVAVFSFLLVFLCGVVAGALIMSLARHGNPPASFGLSSMSVTEMKDELKLSDDQTRQLTSVLEDFSHYYDNLLADGKSRILQILNPDQQKRFYQMIEEHRK